MDNELLSCDRETNELIVEITRRLRREIPNITFDVMSLCMDLTACHNLEHVHLPTLLGAALGDFVHDIGGIHEHLDRETGELGGCFVPRCHKKVA